MPENYLIITGGAGCLGRAIARELAGVYNVLLIDSADASIERAQDELGDNIMVRRADVTDLAALQAIAAELEAREGRVQVVVNCAGTSPKNEGKKKSIEDISAEEWDRVMRINLTGMFNVCKSLVPMMKKQRYGRIINVSSLAGRTQSPTAGIHYCSSKAGVLGFTRCLATELAPFNILVNAIAPGKIVNPDWEEDGDQLDNYISTVPLRRLAEAQEIAHLVRFLASEESSYITGATIDINGGKLMI